MMHAGKNIENRDASVAARLAPFVGQNIGISQSKAFDWVDYEANVLDLKSRGLVDWPYRESLRPDSNVNQSRGKLLLVARLDRIAKPSEYGRNPWHVRGQHGLVLGKVWQVEPVTCTGGAGAWEPTWCVKCGHVVADNARMPGRCYTCKAIFPENRMTRKGMEHLNTNCGGNIERPLLNVVGVCQ
jgi:hypothetical protein